MRKIDLEDELRKNRALAEANGFLQQVHHWIKQEEENERALHTQWSDIGGKAIFKEHLLDLNRIFSEDDVKKLCIDFRLRFLDLALFKEPLPPEAKHRTQELEHLLGEKLSGLMVVGPKEKFTLTESNQDPLLFAPLSNNRYYLIHKWGTEFTVNRRVVMFPLRSIETLLIASIVLSGFIALAFPYHKFSIINVPGHYMGAVFVASFFCIMAMASMILFSFSDGMSENNWKSRYLD